MLKTREKMGLPDLGSPPIVELDKVLKDLGLKERLDEVVSTYGGAQDE
jgi:hypothetical protein